MGETIGQLIKRLRIQAGYDTLGDLYRASGVPVSTLSRIESGTQKPQPDTLSKLAPYLHIKIEFLMAAAGYLPGKNDKIAPQDTIETQWPEGIKVLRRAQQKLTPEKRKKMLRLIEAYIHDEEENEAPKNKK